MPYHQIMSVTMSCAIGLCAMPPCTWLFCEHGTANQNGLLHIHAHRISHILSHIFYIHGFGYSIELHWWLLNLKNGWFLPRVPTQVPRKRVPPSHPGSIFLAIKLTPGGSLIWQFPQFMTIQVQENTNQLTPISPPKFQKRTNNY